MNIYSSNKRFLKMLRILKLIIILSNRDFYFYREKKNSIIFLKRNFYFTLKNFSPLIKNLLHYFLICIKSFKIASRYFMQINILKQEKLLKSRNCSFNIFQNASFKRKFLSGIFFVLYVENEALVQSNEDRNHDRCFCAQIYSFIYIYTRHNYSIRPPLNGLYLEKQMLKGVQSAAKLFEHLQSYLRFFSDFIANFYHLMLVINSIKPKGHNLTNTCLTKLN